MNMNVNVSAAISTRCPTCGGQSLFIGAGGHLTCSRLDCKDPSVASSIEERDSKIRRYEAALVRIAKGEEDIPGLAPEFIRHAMVIALVALGLKPRTWPHEVETLLEQAKRAR